MMEVDILDTDIKVWTGKYFLIQNSACSSGLKASPPYRLILVPVGPASRAGSPGVILETEPMMCELSST